MWIKVLSFGVCFCVNKSSIIWCLFHLHLTPPSHTSISHLSIIPPSIICLSSVYHVCIIYESVMIHRWYMSVSSIISDDVYHHWWYTDDRSLYHLWIMSISPLVHRIARAKYTRGKYAYICDPPYMQTETKKEVYVSHMYVWVKETYVNVCTCPHSCVTHICVSKRPMWTSAYIHIRLHTWKGDPRTWKAARPIYGVATVAKLLKIIGLFCRIVFFFLGLFC